MENCKNCQGTGKITQFGQDKHTHYRCPCCDGSGFTSPSMNRLALPSPAEGVEEVASKSSNDYYTERGWSSEQIGYYGPHYEDGFKAGALWQSRQGGGGKTAEEILDKERVHVHGTLRDRTIIAMERYATQKPSS